MYFIDIPLQPITKQFQIRHINTSKANNDTEVNSLVFLHELESNQRRLEYKAWVQTIHFWVT